MDIPTRPNHLNQAAGALTDHHDRTPRVFGGQLSPYILAMGTDSIPPTSTFTGTTPARGRILPAVPTFWRVFVWVFGGAVTLTIEQEQGDQLTMPFPGAGIMPPFTLKGTAGLLKFSMPSTVGRHVFIMAYAITGLPPNEAI